LLKEKKQRRANNRRKIIIFLLLFFIAAIVIFIYYPTDKKRIRNVITDSSDAIARKDVEGLMGNVSYNYRDDYGNSYLILKKRMEGLFRKYEDIEIERDIKKISLDEGKAVSEITFSVIASEGDSRGYIIGDAVEGVSIRIFLEKSPYRWKVTGADGFSLKEL